MKPLCDCFAVAIIAIVALFPRERRSVWLRRILNKRLTSREKKVVL